MGEASAAARADFRTSRGRLGRSGAAPACGHSLLVPLALTERATGIESGPRIEWAEMSEILDPFAG